MSVNIDHPNEDISTSSSAPPTLGGQSPLVADNATVSVNSSGNVSRYIDTLPSTGSSTNQWIKICELTATANNDAHATFRLVSGLSGVPTIAEFTCRLRYGASIIDTSGTGIDVLYINDQTGYGGLFGMPSNLHILAASTAAGTTAEVWMLKPLGFQTTNLYLIGKSSLGTVNINISRAYQSTDPTTGAAFDIAGDWAGSGQLTSTSFSNGWAGTAYYEKEADGTTQVLIQVTTIGTTTSGTTIFTMPTGFQISTAIYPRVPLFADGVTGGIAGYLEAQPNGDIRIRAYVAGGSNWRSGTLTYKARA